MRDLYPGGDSSVVEHRIVIERLLARGSIPKLAMRRFVVGKDTLRLFPMGVQAVYLLWWPSLANGLQTEQ